MVEKAKKGFAAMKRMRIIFIIVMFAYPLFQFVMFWLVPNFSSLISAFLKVNPRTGEAIFSLSNFTALFNNFADATSQVNRAMINSVFYFIATVVVGIPLTLLLSYFIYKKIFMHKFFRVIFFLPSIISGVVLATLFVNFIEYPISPFNQIISMITGKPLSATPDLIGKHQVITICIYTIWTGFGVNLIMFNTAINRIPADVMEYSRLEGVSMPRELVQIVVPMIFPTVTTVVILGFAGIVTFLQPVMLFRPMPQGDKTGASWSIGYYIYYLFKGALKPDVNFACAVGVFFAACATPIVLGVKLLMDKIVTAVEY